MPLRLKARRPPAEGYPAEPATLGEHLKRRRLDLCLRQTDVAQKLGANKKTYENWEQGRYEPETRFLPGILGFLGYDPRPEGATLGQRIRRRREGDGLTQEDLARRLGLDPSTVAAWEADGVVRPYPRIRRVFETYVEGTDET